MAKARKRFTMSVEKAAALHEHLARQTDWYAECKKCKKVVSGTPEQIKEHVRKCGS